MLFVNWEVKALTEEGRIHSRSTDSMQIKIPGYINRWLRPDFHWTFTVSSKPWSVARYLACGEYQISTHATVKHAVPRPPAVYQSVRSGTQHEAYVAHAGAIIGGFRLSMTSVDLERENLPGGVSLTDSFERMNQWTYFQEIAPTRRRHLHLVPLRTHRSPHPRTHPPRQHQRRARCPTSVARPPAMLVATTMTSTRATLPSFWLYDSKITKL
jgi:hypothetical protein